MTAQQIIVVSSLIITLLIGVIVNLFTSETGVQNWYTRNRHIILIFGILFILLSIFLSFTDSAKSIIEKILPVEREVILPSPSSIYVVDTPVTIHISPTSSTLSQQILGKWRLENGPCSLILDFTNDNVIKIDYVSDAWRSCIVRYTFQKYEFIGNSRINISYDSIFNVAIPAGQYDIEIYKDNLTLKNAASNEIYVYKRN